MYDTHGFADELARAAENRHVGSELLFENDVVKVWAIRLGPGERLPFHRHATSYLYRAHAAGRVRVRFPDGRAVVYDEASDSVQFHEIGRDEVVIHDLENVGETTLLYTTVELLAGSK